MNKNIPTNTKLYESVKKYVYHKIPKHSAYRSGIVVKLYKKLGGTYKTIGHFTKENPPPLTRWFQEEWKDVSPKKYMSSKHYPLYRPTKRVNSKTPTTLNEIPKSNLEKQYKLKQKIKHHTLPKFQKKK
jgi:hypothetical protein